MTSIESTRAGTTGLGAPTSQGTATALDGESFMRLLVAQIRHQDPLQPMDTTAMMAQLTQLTQVERLVAIDDRLGELSIATASVANAQASDLVGRTVEADTSQILLSESGAATGSFELSGPAETVRVEIRDGRGQVVRTLELGAEDAGVVRFNWSGDDDVGNRLAAGRYRISVTALDGEGRPVDASTRLRGEVDAVSYENGYPELEIGETNVVLGDVRSIAAAPPPPPPPGPTTAR